MAKSSTTKKTRPGVSRVSRGNGGKAGQVAPPSPRLTRAPDALRLPSRRDGSNPVALPPSLEQALARSPAPSPWGKKLLSLEAKGDVLRSVYFASEVTSLLSVDAKWNEGPDRPALVPLASGGDQRHYLFIAQPDSRGEYAVVALDDEPSVFVKFASVEHLLASAADAKISADHARRFSRALADAKKRLAKRLALEQFVLDDEEMAPDSSPTPKVNVSPRATAAVDAPPLVESLATLDGLDDLHLYTKKYTVAAEKVIGALARAGTAACGPLRERILDGDPPSAWAAAHALLLLQPTTEEALFVIGALEREATMVDVGIMDRVFPFDDLLRAALGRNARRSLEDAVTERATRREPTRAHVMFGYRAFDEATGDELLTRTVAAFVGRPDHARELAWITGDARPVGGTKGRPLARRVPKRYASILANP